MIRHATLSDLPLLTDWMLSLRQHTSWKDYHHGGYTQDSLQPFLTQHLLSPQSVCVLWDPGDDPQAFCGAQLVRFHLPPYMPIVHEWGWGGAARPAVHCWTYVRQWGRDRGAELACRIKPMKSTSSRIKELATWEVL